MEIRKMESRDLGDVARLSGQLGYPTSVDELGARFEDISSRDTHAVFVAAIEGQVVGWIQVNREPTYLVAAPRAEISALVVDEKSRGQGIGAELVRVAEEWAAREQKLNLVRVRSNVVREKAHRFYLRVGYSIKKSWHLFEKDLK